MNLYIEYELVIDFYYICCLSSTANKLLNVSSW